jgi:hypothetical protein
MKTLKFFLVALLAFAVIPCGSTSVGARNEPSQTQGSTALERGYRTGYSDGYNSGYKDMSDRATNDYQGKEEYQRADRAYVDAWGPIEDSRDGYQQGYEAGYSAAYERRPFESHSRGSGGAATSGSRKLMVRRQPSENHRNGTQKAHRLAPTSYNSAVHPGPAITSGSPNLNDRLIPLAQHCLLSCKVRSRLMSASPTTGFKGGLWDPASTRGRWLADIWSAFSVPAR